MDNKFIFQVALSHTRGEKTGDPQKESTPLRSWRDATRKSREETQSVRKISF